MTFVKDLVRLARPWQWYKNVVVAISLVFGGLLLDTSSISRILIAFVALCLASSGNYVLNDILDRKTDKLSPEKKNRPLAKGSIGIGSAFVFLAILWIGAFALGTYLNNTFTLLIAALIVLTTLYTLWLKTEPIVDAIIIGLNFMIRAAGGAVVLSVESSPLMIIGIFFFAVYLAISKRHSEAMLKKAIKQRKVLSYYTSELTSSLMIVCFTLLLASYAIASFLGHFPQVVWTLPIVLYAGLLHFMLVLKGDPIGRHTHKALKDKRFLISGILWIILVYLLIYVF
jgi:decaprenyl-phosphate phosphoribosyltransferase